MQVKMKDNASYIYQRNALPHGPHTPNYFSQRYHEKIKAIDGQLVEVDTKCLFQNSFNGILADGSLIHIPNLLVDEVIDDARVGKGKCNYCGNITDKPMCYNCEHGEKYVKMFDTRTSEQFYKDRGYDMWGNPC